MEVGLIMQSQSNRSSNSEMMIRQLMTIAQRQEQSAGRLRAIQNIMTGALLAVTVAGGFVVLYLVTETYLDRPLIQYVLMSDNTRSIMQSASENLFTVIARFIMAFSLSWLPMTLIVYIVNRVRD